MRLACGFREHPAPRFVPQSRTLREPAARTAALLANRDQVVAEERELTSTAPWGRDGMLPSLITGTATRGPSRSNGEHFRHRILSSRPLSDLPVVSPFNSR